MVKTPEDVKRENDAAALRAMRVAAYAFGGFLLLVALASCLLAMAGVS